MEDTDEDCFSQFFQESSDSLGVLNQSKFLSPTKLDSSQDRSQSSESDLSLSQLTLEEQEPLKVLPYFNITPREMPISPHFILEEELSNNPWALLVATVFLTKTAGKTARPYMKDFFLEHPTPYHVLQENPKGLERFFDSLGLRKRAHIIWKLSYQYVSAKWRRASDLNGIGKYGEDAYRMFCLGHTDLEPNDRYLKLYLDWLQRHTEFLEDNGEIDCECVIEDPVSKYYVITLRDLKIN